MLQWFIYKDTFLFITNWHWVAFSESLYSMIRANEICQNWPLSSQQNKLHLVELSFCLLFNERKSVNRKTLRTTATTCRFTIIFRIFCFDSVLEKIFVVQLYEINALKFTCLEILFDCGIALSDTTTNSSELNRWIAPESNRIF